MHKVLPLLVLVSLAACAFPQTRWDKPGANEKMTADDLLNCRHAAQQEAFLDAPAPVIGPWAAHHWWRTENDRFYMENRLTDFCMRSKGYTLVDVPPPPRTAAPQAPAATDPPTGK
jgi:hypothetical protein